MPTSEQFGAIFEGKTMLGLGSAELLHHFAARRDEAAFAALVDRHGPMVLATCRRILPNGADADDAFQATFLVLARKARSIGDPDRLAPWLHGVARRVASKARSNLTRVQATTAGQTDAALDNVAVDPPPLDAFEVRGVIDDELARLPPRYREALVLCYLEGMTHDEAARQLACPVGTVRSRLAGGRDRLRTRLTRRGFAPGALAILSPASLPESAVSRPLLVATVRLASAGGLGKVAGPAALLAQGVLTSMLITKVQTLALGVTLGTTLIAGTAGVVARQQPAADPKAVPHLVNAAPGKADDEVFMPPSAGDLVTAITRIRELQTELDAILKRAEPVPFNSLHARPTKLGQPVVSLPGAGTASAPTVAAAAAESPEEELYRRNEEVRRLGAEAARATGPARVALDEQLKQATAQFWTARLNGDVPDNYSWEMTRVPGKLQLQIGKAEVTARDLTRQLTAMQDRVKALRGELSAWEAKHQASESTFQPNQPARATATATTLNPAAPPPSQADETKPQSAPTRTGSAGDTVKPDPKPQVQEIINTSILLVISAERDRITAVNTATQKRATLTLHQPVTTVESNVTNMFAAGNLWQGVTLVGPSITRLALLDSSAMVWHEHDLTKPVRFAAPRMSSMGGRIPFALEGDEVAKAVAFDGRSRTWITEPLQGGPQTRVTATNTNSNFNRTDIFQAGPFYYFLKANEPRWTVVEVKQAPRGPANLRGGSGIVPPLGDYNVPGVRSLPNGTLYLQDGNLLIMYNPGTGELTRVDTTEK